MLDKKKSRLNITGERWSLQCHAILRLCHGKHNRVHYDNRHQQENFHICCWIHNYQLRQVYKKAEVKEKANWSQSELQPRIPPSIPLAPTAAHSLWNIPLLLSILKRMVFIKRHPLKKKKKKVLIFKLEFQFKRNCFDSVLILKYSTWVFVLCANCVLHLLIQSVFPSGGRKMSLPCSTSFPA